MRNALDRDGEGSVQLLKRSEGFQWQVPGSFPLSVDVV